LGDIKLLITTIAAVLVVGCGPPEPPDFSIHEAVGIGNIEAVKQHLAAGTDVNAETRDRVTPLHPAAANGHKEIAELLIAEGADVNAKAVTGETPLDSAIKSKHTETANLLRKHGGKTSEELKAEGK
jgi:ankyrin repeat protein